MLSQEPIAYADIRGNVDHPDLRGRMTLYETHGGSIVAVEVTGIQDEDGKWGNGFLGFHIHEGEACSGSDAEPFADAGGHYDPGDRPHPWHAGDLPPLLANRGVAWMMVYTDRFFPEEVVGRTVILHGMPDDFRTQPAGDAGERIACGQIREWVEK